MKICGTNLVPIFVTIIFCGVIFVYFNMRLAEVKNAVEKQNRVLTAFITNVQSDIKSGGMMFGPCATASTVGAVAGTMGTGPCGTIPCGTGAGASANHLASEEALQAVKRNEKIVVSDDEDDDDEDDSDSESDSDDSESSDDDDDDDTSEPVKMINLQQDSAVSLELITDNLTLDFDCLPSMLVDSSFSSALNESSLKVIDLNSTMDAPTMDAPTIDALTIDASTIDAPTMTEMTKTDVIYEQMKVDDLRKIVSDLNLAVKDDAKKLKKPELLALLKNKSA